MSLLSTLRFVASQPLNRRRKFDSLLRFAKWQIGSRLVPGAVAYEWINGARFLVRPGETGLTGNIYAGLHEFPDMAFLLHVLRPDDLFIDAGANVGSYTILACAVARARGHAFEPATDTYQRLVDNLRLNKLDERVETHNVGLGRSCGVLAFTAGLDTMNHALPAGEHSLPSIQIQVTKLDDAVSIDAPTLMKIDVEGYEMPVLEGADRTLCNPLLHSIIMELNGSGSRYGFDEAAILRKLSAFGFETYAYEPFARKLVSLHGKNLASGNTLFIRDMALVNDRLSNGPKFRIHGVAI